jgi:hypothetical protein
MATDITTLLIQKVTAASGQPNGLAVNRAALNSAADLLSTVADYAQILGIAVPVVQALAAAVINQVAEDAGAVSAGTLAAALSEATTALTGGAIAAVVANPYLGAIVILIISVVAAILSAVGSGQSNQSQQFLDILAALNDALDDLIDLDLATYWQGKLTGNVPLLWSPVETDLDNLAREGTGPQATDVLSNVSHFHGDGLAFVNLLVKDISFEQYWEVPGKTAGDVPQLSDTPPAAWATYFLGSGGDDFAVGWQYLSWYGHFPIRLPSDGSPGGNVQDPRTFAPILALGIQSYLTLQSLLNVIDPSQLTFQQFLSDFGGDLADPSNPPSSPAYTNFLYEKYKLAVNGIVKTDLPSEDEILGFLWAETWEAGVLASPLTNPGQPTTQSWGAPPPLLSVPNAAFSGDGLFWNGTLGASETYPLYGFYGDAQFTNAAAPLFADLSPPVVWVSTPAYILSYPDTSNMVSQWQGADILVYTEGYGGEWLVDISSLQNWTIPWLENRLILGRMARWKALYLLNGFDALWSFLQALQQLAAPNPPVVPATMTLDQDGTIASGNWSARELCKVVVVQGNLLYANTYVSVDNEFLVSPGYPGLPGHSVAALLQFFYNVANGNWAGPPEPDGADIYYPQVGPPRPLSFRGLLAGAAS